MTIDDHQEKFQWNGKGWTIDTRKERGSTKAEENKGGFIVGGDNYGQGSSREHAALAPLYLGIKAVLAKSFARIHRANLINSGILPLEFENEKDYDEISQMDELEIENIFLGFTENRIKIKNKTKNTIIYTRALFDKQEVEVLKAGGKLNRVKEGRIKNA